MYTVRYFNWVHNRAWDCERGKLREDSRQANSSLQFPFHLVWSNDDYKFHDM